MRGPKQMKQCYSLTLCSPKFMYWYPNPQVIVLSSVPFEEGLGL